MDSYELVKVLTNKRRLAAFLREIGIESSKTICENIMDAVGDMEKAHLAELENAKKKQEEIQAWKEKLVEAGIDPLELIKSGDVSVPSAKTKQQRQKRPPKYKYIDHDGVECTWTGQGRMPKPINEALEKGESLESFLI